MRPGRWAVVVVALATFFGGGWLLRQGIAGRTVNGQVQTNRPPVSGDRLFQDVLRHVQTYAVDSLDEGAAYRIAAGGMLDELGDPYAALVPIGGLPADSAPPLGVNLDFVDGLVTVVSVRPGSPAAAAGIRAGDIVLEVDSTGTERMRPDQVAATLRAVGKQSFPVRLARNRTPIRITLNRGSTPPLADPSLDLGGDGIARLTIFGLGPGTAEKARAAIAGATSRLARRLIIDLRGVAEGSRDEAVALASLFLEKGATVIVTRGRASTDSASIRVPKDGDFRDIPTAVLIDRGTAGPAEVVAGALQDNDRALLVGEPSFGRGADVSVFPIWPTLGLRLTTALWHTPSGRVIQREREPESRGSEPKRPEFQTEGGRTVLGGGGIVPDREVAVGLTERDSADGALTLARQLLARAESTRMLLALDRR